MPLVVRDLLGIASLRLSVAAGSAGLDNPIRFAHTSELPDPTPWLSGGEVLLTTGMALRGSPASQRAYVRRLARGGLAGLGFGVGFGFEEVPGAVRAAAEAEGFPVLEVPYPVPFIAITEAIAARLAEERLRVAEMSVEAHERLTGMIAEGTGPADVLDVLAELAGGWALLFDARGGVLAGSREGHAPPEAASVWAGLPPGVLRGSGPAAEVSPRGTSLALAVFAGGRPEAVLVFGKERRLEQSDRIVVRHAVTVLGLLLSLRRAVIHAERRISGDVLNDAFAGRLAGADLERRLGLAGFPAAGDVTVLVIEPRSGDPGAEALEDLAWAADALLGSRCAAVRTAVLAGRVAAAVAHHDPPSLAGVLEAELGRASSRASGRGVRVGVGTGGPAAALRDSYLAALFALRAAPPGQGIGLPDDLGSYRFLLGAQSRPLLEGFVRSVIGPLIDRDECRSSELVESVRAFIAASGRWEQGADGLGVHRHTLRYRIRAAEDLLGRDLSSAEDRMEVWLALKALEVLNA